MSFHRWVESEFRRLTRGREVGLCRAIGDVRDRECWISSPSDMQVTCYTRFKHAPYQRLYCSQRSIGLLFAGIGIKAAMVDKLQQQQTECNCDVPGRSCGYGERQAPLGSDRFWEPFPPKMGTCQYLSPSDLVLDEVINLYKSVVETNANANAALSRANKEANDGLSQLRTNFALAMQMFQDQVTHDVEATFTKTESFFKKLVNNMDAAVQLVLSKTGSTVRDLESDAASLSEVSQFGRSRCTPKCSSNG